MQIPERKKAPKTKNKKRESRGNTVRPSLGVRRSRTRPDGLQLHPSRAGRCAHSVLRHAARRCVTRLETPSAHNPTARDISHAGQGDSLDDDRNVSCQCIPYLAQVPRAITQRCHAWRSGRKAAPSFPGAIIRGPAWLVESAPARDQRSEQRLRETGRRSRARRARAA